MNSTSNVSIGPSTIVGYAVGVLGVLTTALTAISGSEAQLHGPGKWTAILGVISIVVTNIGRQAQSLHIHLHVPAPVTQTLAELPTLAEELASPPPSAPVVSAPFGVVPAASSLPTGVVPDGAAPAAPPVAPAPAA